MWGILLAACMSVITLEQALASSAVGSSDVEDDAATCGSVAVGLEQALAWCMGDGVDDDDNLDGLKGKRNKFHPVLQRERARVGWLRRKSLSERLHTDEAADLHRMHINAHQAVRSCDLLPADDLGAAQYCKSVPGKGMYQVFNPRAFLRVAFASPFESLVETAAKFPSSATGKPASIQHVKDCKLCAAQILREETLQQTRKVFWPVDRWEYVVQSLCFDEASFKVAAAGEKPMESPCLGSACALLTKPVDKGPELVNLHGPLVVMNDKPQHSEIPSLNSKCCLKSFSFAKSFFTNRFLSSVSVY
jgi:hypothetical protein